MMLNELLPGVGHMQNVHPLVVHFPLALLVLSVPAYLASVATSSKLLPSVAFTLLVAGSLGAAAALGTGLYAEDGVIVSESVRVALINPHKYFMVAATIFDDLECH